jgi:phosphatidylglycerophosphate synthase
LIAGERPTRTEQEIARLEKPPEHTRINDIFLGPLERPALKWLAAHTPAWWTPDHYTITGVLGGFIILAGYALSNLHPGFLWLANLGFLVNWVGDSLDGTLARFRDIQRPIYGFYIDHVTDAAMQVLIFTGLGLTPYVSFNVACLALVGYLLLSVLVYVRTCLVGEFKISYGKLGPTEARALAVLLNVVMFVFREQGWPVRLGAFGQLTVNPYDLVVGAIALLILYFFVSTATKEAIRLAKIDR